MKRLSLLPLAALASFALFASCSSGSSTDTSPVVLGAGTSQIQTARNFSYDIVSLAGNGLAIACKAGGVSTLGSATEVYYDGSTWSTTKPTTVCATLTLAKDSTADKYSGTFVATSSVTYSAGAGLAFLGTADFSYDTGSDPDDAIFLCSLGGSFTYGGTPYTADFSAEIRGHRYLCSGTVCDSAATWVFGANYTIPTQPELNRIRLLATGLASKADAALYAALGDTATALAATTVVYMETAGGTWTTTAPTDYVAKVTLAVGSTSSKLSASLEVKEADSVSYHGTFDLTYDGTSSTSEVYTVKGSLLAYTGYFVDSSVDYTMTCLSSGLSSKSRDQIAAEVYSFSGTWQGSVYDIAKQIESASFKLAGLTFTPSYN